MNVVDTLIWVGTGLGFFALGGLLCGLFYLYHQEKRQ